MANSNQAKCVVFAFQTSKCIDWFNLSMIAHLEFANIRLAYWKHLDCNECFASILVTSFDIFTLHTSNLIKWYNLLFIKNLELPKRLFTVLRNTLGTTNCNSISSTIVISVLARF